MRRLFYDLESSGFLKKNILLSHPDQCRIVQIAAILDDTDRPEDQREIMRLDIILQVDHIPTEAANIHGITTERSQQVGLDEGTALELFLQMVDKADMVVGFNHIAFDNQLVTAAMRRLYQKEEIDPFANMNMFDVMLAAQPVCKIPAKNGGIKKPKLIEAYQYFFGHPFEGAHAAINDVLATRAIFYELQKLITKKS